MRKGSAAIVPLFLAIMLLFWFIWFLGGEGDSLEQTSDVTNLTALQKKLLRAAVIKRYDALEQDKLQYSEDDPAKKAALDAKISQDIHNMMKNNKIDD